MINYYSYKTVLGTLCFQSDGTGITRISFREGNENGVKEETDAIRQAYAQIDEYLRGNRISFDFPLNPEGTPFQKRVWDVLRTIPYGEVWSYKQVAVAVGNPRASRAVGMANNRNPLPLVVPCHRVVGADGKLVGYAGGLDIKEKLLTLEKEHSSLGGSGIVPWQG